jgi:prepilin-type processing-associated H-X9-DG protein
MRPPRGFTFLELIVSMSLIMLLVALLLPVFAHTRESARRTACQSNLSQLVTATHLYAQDNNGLFPPNPDDLRWVTTVEPYVKNYQVLRCPSEPNSSAARYGAGRVTGTNLWGTSYRYEGGLANDSPGNTPLGWDWMAWHDGGLNVVFVDGHVEWMRDAPPFNQGRSKRPVPGEVGPEPVEGSDE